MPALADVAVPAPFRPRGEHLEIDLGDATALFTTRRGGVSEGPFATLNLGRSTDDEDDRVDENRDLLAVEVGAAWGRFARARQVHATRVRRVLDEPRAEDPWEEADGHATALGGVPALVFVADCLPVAVAAPDAVAILHCGWRGLAGGIVAAGVAVVRELGDVGGGLRAAIGPGIGVCCYEVGDEVRAAFPASAVRGRNLDLAAVACRALEDAGVEEVHDAGLCTACHPELFFSHRRDRGVTGRQAGVVWRRPA